VYAITRSLWHPTTAKLFAALDRSASASGPTERSTGFPVPLHPAPRGFIVRQAWRSTARPGGKAGRDKQP
jgi:hypothetical protein